jgi:hypothetical protein
MITFFCYLCVFLLGGITVLVLALIYAIVGEEDEEPKRHEARSESRIGIQSAVTAQNSDGGINLTYH